MEPVVLLGELPPGPPEIVTADVIRSLRGRPPVHLLPYHRMGSDKYERLGAPYGMPELEPPTRERVAEIAGRLAAAGVDVSVGG